MPTPTNPQDERFCWRCYRATAACLCPHITELTPRTKVVLLTHPKEARKTRNGSGRLAHLSLRGSEVLVGTSFQDHPRVTQLLGDPRCRCTLLYPGETDAPRPGAEAGRRPDRPRVLFVLDGTWPLAKKMMRLSPRLHGLPRLSLEVDRPSEFVIKHQPDPRCLATVEAVDRALLALADRGEDDWGPEESERLLRPFRALNAYNLACAADPERTSYRGGGPYKRPEDRRGRKAPRSGRRILFQG